MESTMVYWEFRQGKDGSVIAFSQFPIPGLLVHVQPKLLKHWTRPERTVNKKTSYGCRYPDPQGHPETYFFFANSGNLKVQFHDIDAATGLCVCSILSGELGAIDPTLEPKADALPQEDDSGA